MIDRMTQYNEPCQLNELQLVIMIYLFFAKRGEKKRMCVFFVCGVFMDG